MKIKIIADSQQEFDEKRDRLVKALAPKKRLAIEPRRSPFKAQNEILDYWNEKFLEMLADIKQEIDDVVG